MAPAPARERGWEQILQQKETAHGKAEEGGCDMVIHNKHIFCSCSWHRAPKTWNFPSGKKDKGVFYDSRKPLSTAPGYVTFRKPLGMGLVARGTNQVIRGLELSVPLSSVSKSQ